MPTTVPIADDRDGARQVFVPFSSSGVATSLPVSRSITCRLLSQPAANVRLPAMAGEPITGPPGTLNFHFSLPGGKAIERFVAGTRTGRSRRRNWRRWKSRHWYRTSTSSCPCPHRCSGRARPCPPRRQRCHHERLASDEEWTRPCSATSLCRSIDQERTGSDPARANVDDASFRPLTQQRLFDAVPFALNSQRQFQLVREVAAQCPFDLDCLEKPAEIGREATWRRLSVEEHAAAEEHFSRWCDHEAGSSHGTSPRRQEYADS